LIYTRIIGRIGVLSIVAMLLASSWACAANHFALATTASSLYLLQTESKWGTNSYISLGNPGDSSSRLAGVATSGKYAFVVDAGKNQLYVGTVTDALGAPAFNVLSTVPVADGATSVAVGSDGGVYVVGNQAYSYITATDWATPTVQTVSVPGVLIAGVAGLSAGDKAAIINQLVSEPSNPGQSYTALLDGASSSTPKSLEVGCGSPISVAVDPSFGDLGYAYIANRTSSGINDVGSLRIYNPATNGFAGTAIVLSIDNEAYQMVPDAISTFFDDTGRYIGIVGTVNGEAQQAWKIAINGGDVSLAGANRTALTGADLSTARRTSTSDDGEVYWITGGKTGRVYAWNTKTWTSLDAFSAVLGDSAIVSYVSSYKPEIIPPVIIPEPSSVVALATLAAGALGLIRRRKK